MSEKHSFGYYDLHGKCLHETRPDMTPKERADKCGCITMIGFKICCECREYQESQNMVCDR